MSIFSSKKKQNTSGEEKTFKVPNPIIIIACIILISAVASYIIPAGIYDRVEDVNTRRSVVDPSTFRYTDQNPTGFLDLFTSVTRGIQEGSSIIAFLFIVGGSLGILSSTGSINSGLSTLVKKMKGKELLMIPVIMLVFSTCSTLAGCNEEYLAFLPLLITVCLAMGFDSITALALVFCSVGAGYGAGCTNAFTVGVAQGIAGLPVFSAIEYRIFIFAILVVLNITFVMRYAMKVKKNPQASAMYEYDRTRTLDLNVDEIDPLTGRQKICLIALALTFVCLIIGVIKFGFYMDEISALFLIMGIATGLIGGLKVSEIADSFVSGCKGMMLPCLMVGLCKAATIILNDASIMDTIVHALAGILNHFPSSLTAFGMFIVQDLFNILVPSGSGQAAITMPIMAPLADLVGVTRQTAVFAFQFGDAFTNAVTPASGMTMSCLALAAVPYKKWFRFIIPLIGLWWIVAFCFLTYATAIGIGPL